MNERTSTPTYFGPPDRPLFGWLHRPTARASSLGLVVCNPFGYEAICAHRSLRHFCERAAAAGITALRFDYDGSGDSAGSDRDPERLAAWIKSVHHAIDLVRRAGEVERVALLGVRLGALVATLAAVERDDLDGVIAIAPVVAGKAHLRELRALQMQLSRPPTPSGVVVEEGVQEALGFVLTAETKSALSAIDLTKLDRRPAPNVLLIERDDLPASDAWPERLAAQGVAVERQRLPGYTEMMLGPQDAQVPQAMVAAATEWLKRRAAAASGVAAANAATAASAPAASARFTVGDPPRTVVESAEFIDAERRLFGVLSNPVAAPPAARKGLLLLNAGSVHHIGSNRLYVTLARRWAALGHAVLRLDMSGVGDSRPRPGEPENIVYTDHASADVAAALAFLRRQPGVVEVHALGLCSGGYNAFKAAVAGVPLDGVVLINPLTFFFKPGMSLDAAPYHVTSEASRYTRRLYSLDAWKKLLRGDVHLQAMALVFARRVGLIARDQARAIARQAGIKLGDDLALELQNVTRRKVELRFIFAADDPGVSLLKAQGGATVDKLRRQGQLGIDLIDGADHTFTPLWSHPLVIDRLAAHLDGPPRARR
jgi:alpha-beta hydrolase superfamily lysophospholipase